MREEVTVSELSEEARERDVDRALTAEQLQLQPEQSEQPGETGHEAGNAEAVEDDGVNQADDGA